MPLSSLHFADHTADSMNSSLQLKSKIALITPNTAEEYFTLLRAAAHASEVELVRWNDCAAALLDGVLFIHWPGHSGQLPDPPLRLPSFRVELVQAAEPHSSISFSKGPVLSPLLRGRRLITADPAPANRILAGDEVLAEINGRPVWTTRVKDGARQDFSLQALPWIAGDDRIFAHLNGHSLMRMLPIIEWFRAISDWVRWQKPPIRASFMFDDPNLHSKQYGYISFPQLAAQGRRHRYHAAFATVPLDHYYVNREAARLFRESPGVLSLLIHGNDHTNRELAGKEALSHGLAKVQQALTRIERMERRSGVPIARVMAPPHGAFGATMMKACAAAGFEAACVSWGSVWSSNRQNKWPRLLGASSATVVEGLPLIPRFRMAWGIENHILLTAYLGQPIIPVGHQWDLADGVELLAELAAFTNGLGEVNWLDMAAIARSSFWQRAEGSTLCVRPFSLRFEVDVPDGFREVQISAPWMVSSTEVSTGPTNEGDKISPCEKLDESTWNISVDAPGVINVNIQVQVGEFTTHSGPVQTSLWALARRILAESRDRLTPKLPRRWQKK